MARKLTIPVRRTLTLMRNNCLIMEILAVAFRLGLVKYWRSMELAFTYILHWSLFGTRCGYSCFLKNGD